MVKLWKLAVVIAVPILILVGIVFLLNSFGIIKIKLWTTTTTTTTTTSTTTTTTTTSTTTTLPISNCVGANNRACNWASKYDCTMATCCFWNETLSKCKPRACSDIEEDFCGNCGCTPP